MTRDHQFGGEITSAEAFREALGEMLRSAHTNGIEVRGGWELRNGPALPDWEAVVVEMEKQAEE